MMLLARLFLPHVLVSGTRMLDCLTALGVRMGGLSGATQTLARILASAAAALDVSHCAEANLGTAMSALAGKRHALARTALDTGARSKQAAAALQRLRTQVRSLHRCVTT